MSYRISLFSGQQTLLFTCFQAFDVAEEHLGIPPQISASEMAMKLIPDTLMIVSYVSQYHEVFKNETPGTCICKEIFSDFSPDNFQADSQRGRPRRELERATSDCVNQWNSWQIVWATLNT